MGWGVSPVRGVREDRGESRSLSTAYFTPLSALRPRARLVSLPQVFSPCHPFAYHRNEVSVTLR
jgi:hypothetical protein